MPRLHALLECVGQALCEKGRKALRGQWPYADIILDTAKVAFDLAHRKLPGPDLVGALADCAACPDHEFDRRVGEIITELAETHHVPKEALADYLRGFPPTVRQTFRRPTDPAGTTAPDGMLLHKAEDLLRFLPPRPPRFRPGERPPHLDNWTLTELRGLGECSEVWRAEDPDRPDDSPAALKFAIDPETRTRVTGGTALFQKVFALNDIPGVLPLRSVYLESDPPCLDAPFVFGYDLAGVMLEWRHRYAGPKPEAALKLVRRLAGILAAAHAQGVTHRDLKPSNVLMHPTEGGKFTMWVTDFGWGEIEAVRSLELAKAGPRGEQVRLARRGAATEIYASPQQMKREPPAPTDDIHAVGVIWYQLLKRDPAEAAPVGNEWIEELRPHGFSDSQAKVLQSCLATRPDKRPKNAVELAELLSRVTMGTVAADHGTDGSRLLATPAARAPTSKPATTVVTTAGGRPFDPDATAVQASALLASLGGSVVGAAGPKSNTGGLRMVKNSVGMNFVRIAPGSFRMGSEPDEHGHREHEAPPHEVQVSRRIYLSVFPVTQNEYHAVMGKNPSKHPKGGEFQPVESVSWHDAEQFCAKLSSRAEEAGHHRSYRLPTEAEWEYACRAGSTTPFACGATLTAADAVFNTGARDAPKHPAAVGGKPANAWGLCDMHGNVQEWVMDWYDEYFYTESPPDDPIGPPRGMTKVARGGAWNMPSPDCRSAARRAYTPDTRSESIGFRVVLVSG
ncbi:SUMF1/EgtB/PvdO family nonheme iron enzyme [Urbifossiella limnaea]|uniref:Serine/threonine-protein kinase pkn1 n=1 Tax=Urbifossiella limnaea TaxID=2528023 RepID=A0A517XPG7_9BACT|nr:SUMF1/EgtB/PvdO family nonheme iron enzyme [Urbifossiella limnaea]QDU19393.1 Serine/threonine-protein kinase pkn1 [Urbifossiella limnaea]